MRFFEKALRSNPLITLIIAYGVEAGEASSFKPELIPISSVTVQTQSGLDSSRLGLSVPVGIRVHNLDKKGSAVNFTQNETQDQRITTVDSTNTTGLSFQDKSAPIFRPDNAPAAQSLTSKVECTNSSDSNSFPDNSNSVLSISTNCTEEKISDKNKTISVNQSVTPEANDSRSLDPNSSRNNSSLSLLTTSSNVDEKTSDKVTINSDSPKSVFSNPNGQSFDRLGRSINILSSTCTTLTEASPNTLENNEKGIIVHYSSTHEEELKKTIEDLKAKVRELELENKGLKADTKTFLKAGVDMFYVQNLSTYREVLERENKNLKSKNKELQRKLRMYELGCVSDDLFHRSELNRVSTNNISNNISTPASKSQAQVPVQPQFINASTSLNLSHSSDDDDTSSERTESSSEDDDTFLDGDTPIEPGLCSSACSINSDDADTLSSDSFYSVSVTSKATNNETF